MRRPLIILAALILSVFFTPASAQTAKALDIYVVDVEGGNAVLFVSPSGQTVLMDGGNGGAAAVRDADRIMAAVKAAGVASIDHVIVTHWHTDHIGAFAELSTRVSLKHFVDHGPNVQQPNVAGEDFLKNVYPELLARATHTVAKAGDKLPIAGLDWRIVTSGGQAQKTSLPGGGRRNPACADSAPKTADTTENAQSVGSVVTLGTFRLVHLGDLTWNKELDLMCPTNTIGTVDLLLVGHHGQNNSNSPALVHALRPRVAVMNNGTRKGGQPETMKVLYSSPGLEDLWQMHFSLLSGQEYTPPGVFIANPVDDEPTAMPIAPMTPPQGFPPQPPHNGPAHWIKISAQSDGTFTVTNARNGFSKTYRAHPPS